MGLLFIECRLYYVKKPEILCIHKAKWALLICFFFFLFAFSQLIATCASLHTVTAEFYLTGYMPTTTEKPLLPECSDAMTCRDCTAGTTSLTCHWSAERQACETGDGGGTGNLTVSRASDCPATSVTYDGRKYRVIVTNDKIGLMPYLERVGVNCSRGWLTALPGHVAHVRALHYGGIIACTGYPLQPDSTTAPATISGSFYVTFGPNRVLLRTDDRAKYYASNMYDRKCGHGRSEYCIGCMRTGTEQRWVTDHILSNWQLLLWEREGERFSGSTSSTFSCRNRTSILDDRTPTSWPLVQETVSFILKLNFGYFCFVYFFRVYDRVNVIRVYLIYMTFFFFFCVLIDTKDQIHIVQQKTVKIQFF